MILLVFVHYLNPDGAWIEMDGERQRVMDMSWGLAVLGGVILAPILVNADHSRVKRNKILEMIFVGIFVITSAILFWFY